MGKAAFIILVAVFAAVCGALGWELMREKELTRQLKQQPPATPVATETRRDDTTSETLKRIEDRLGGIEERLSDVEKGYTAFLERLANATNKMDEFSKKLKEAEEKGVVAPSGGFDPTKMSEEEREKFNREVARAMFRTIMTRATEFKDAMVKNFQSQIEQNADKLDLAPMQVEEIKALVKDMADKGFKKMGELLQQGKVDQLRAAGEELLNEFDERAKQILQPDQIEKWKELDPEFKRREERRQKKLQEQKGQF
ncbi:MAG: hypothetical protein N2234_07205 [Planctomycetota bacterium]|nr:hypothetical protein [Planctomycetota bacterium]